MRSILNLKNDKKAILRILEAFIAIMLILSVVLILMYRQRADFSNQDEIARLQRDILNFISKDDSMRGQILSDQLYGVDEKVKLLMPYGYKYYLKICNYKDICSLGCYVPSEVYSYETLIVANLTYYVPEESKKLKLFMWYGAWPSDCPVPNYTRPIVVGEPGVANVVTSLTHIVYASATNVNIGGYVYPLVHYYNHYREFTVTNGIGVNLTKRQLCGLYEPRCVNITANIRVNNTYTMINGQFYTLSEDTNPNNDYNEFALTYFGIDDLGNSVIVPFQTLYVNGSKFGFSLGDVA